MAVHLDPISDLHSTTFHHGRAPRRGPRMFPRGAAIGSVDGCDRAQIGAQIGAHVGDQGQAVSAGGVSAGRVSVRIAVTARMIRMTEFGLRFVRDEGDGSRWWARVADEMGSLVSAHVPHDARSVEMASDSESLEVVVEYDAPGPRLV